MTLLRSKVNRAALSRCEMVPEDASAVMLTLPIRCRVRGGRTWVVTAGGSTDRRKNKPDPVLIRGLRQAHRIMAEIGWRCADGSVELQTARSPDSAYTRKLCRLAFLAPDIQRLILEGRQPAGINLEVLVQVGFSTSWAEQRRQLGLRQE